MQWQEHTKCSSPSLSNSNKATNAYGGNKRGRTKEEKHPELQDQDLLGSPHLEERWIGGIVDLDLLSQIPQRYARIMGGIKRGTSFSNVNNGGRERGKHAGRSLALWGRKGPFIGTTK